MCMSMGPSLNLQLRRIGTAGARGLVGRGYLFVVALLWFGRGQGDVFRPRQLAVLLSKGPVERKFCRARYLFIRVEICSAYRTYVYGEAVFLCGGLCCCASLYSVLLYGNEVFGVLYGRERRLYVSSERYERLFRRVGSFFKF